MNRDVKLGLALGMLVIGFAAAFCFPRQPTAHVTSDAKSPPTSDSTQFDLIPIRAYEQPSGPKSGSAAASSTGLEEDLVLPAAAISSHKIEPVVPQLIPVPPPDQRSSTSSTPAPAFRPSSPPAKASPAAEGGAQQRQYVVQPGDTLSSIAVEMLGSSARFAEIYAANRHQLPSPNDLKPNMVLVIPPRVRQAVEPTLADVPIAEPDDPVNPAPQEEDAPPFPQISEQPPGTLH